MWGVSWIRASGRTKVVNKKRLTAVAFMGQLKHVMWPWFHCLCFKEKIGHLSPFQMQVAGTEGS